ncbi:hypothetical protein M0813_27071 [Anaeramoeba flamelloides]|uniref:Cyclin n=1 Tax=Anaeramoeba flamelloides TaxID=1746091 RepID=A0ABQ8Y1F3_9EUKA|nr:hypothetical protein M0813_27071 [Anaeramoeba flamelloides]
MESTKQLLDHFANTIERVLEFHTCPKNMFSPFYSPIIPMISIKDYLERIGQYCECSQEAYVIGIEFLRRYFILNPEYQLNRHNAHQLIVTCFLVASKLCDDVCYSNLFYSELSGIELEQLNLFELDLLFGLNFSLSYDPEHYCSALLAVYEEDVTLIDSTLVKQEIIQKNKIVQKDGDVEKNLEIDKKEETEEEEEEKEQEQEEVEEVVGETEEETEEEETQEETEDEEEENKLFGSLRRSLINSNPFDTSERSVEELMKSISLENSMSESEEATNSFLDSRETVKLSMNIVSVFSTENLEEQNKQIYSLKYDNINEHK